MKIRSGQLGEYVGKKCLFKWVLGQRCTPCPADDWYVYRRVLTFDISSHGNLKLYDDDGYIIGYLHEADYDVKWYFEALEDCGVEQTNKGLTQCWKCSCHTEERRDFSTFEVREFCPRCKI